MNVQRYSILIALAAMLAAACDDGAGDGTDGGSATPVDTTVTSDVDKDKLLTELSNTEFSNECFAVTTKVEEVDRSIATMLCTAEGLYVTWDIYLRHGPPLSTHCYGYRPPNGLFERLCGMHAVGYR